MTRQLNHVKDETEYIIKKATISSWNSAFASLAIRPGKAFLRRLYNLLKSLPVSFPPNHHIRLSAEAQKDINAGLPFKCTQIITTA